MNFVHQGSNRATGAWAAFAPSIFDAVLTYYTTQVLPINTLTSLLCARFGFLQLFLIQSGPQMSNTNCWIKIRWQTCLKTLVGYLNALTTEEARRPLHNAVPSTGSSKHCSQATDFNITIIRSQHIPCKRVSSHPEPGKHRPFIGLYWSDIFFMIHYESM